jgi:hypothetical protein
MALEGLNLRQTIKEFAARLKCAACGNVGGQAMPVWKNGGWDGSGAHRGNY